MKNLTLVLAIMITGMVMSQDLSSYTVTEIVDNESQVRDGVWTTYQDDDFAGDDWKGYISTGKRTMFIFDRGNSFDRYKTVTDHYMALIMDNKDKIGFNYRDGGFDEWLDDQKSRAGIEVFEATVIGGGIASSFVIHDGNVKIYVHMLLEEGYYSLNISESVKPTTGGGASF